MSDLVFFGSGRKLFCFDSFHIDDAAVRGESDFKIRLSKNVYFAERCQGRTKIGGSEDYYED